MKPGANRSDQLQIFRLMHQGYTAKQISHQIKVYESTVKNFMKAFKDSKNHPQTTSFAQAKQGMPKHPSPMAGARAASEEEITGLKKENDALKARLDALEAATVSKDKTTSEDKTAKK